MSNYHYIITPALKQMLEHFYRISGLRIGIHGKEMQIISEYPEKTGSSVSWSFCDRVRLSSPQFEQTCKTCDLLAYKEICKTGHTYIYRCHAGFLEALVPVFCGGELVCALMIGQTRDRCNDKDFGARLDQMVPDLPRDEAECDVLREAYDALPCLDEKTFESYAYFLEICAKSIIDQCYLGLSEKSLSARFEEYVLHRLEQPLSVCNVAQALQISPSHLSRVLKRDLGTTFTQYVTDKRLEQAKKLLLTTDLTVCAIAEQLCFHDAGYFMRLFKSETGMTCGDYRKRFSLCADSSCLS